MRSTKKWLSLLLCFALLCSFLPQMAVPARAAETSGECGDDLYWSFDDSKGILTIFGTGEMYRYDESDDESYAPWNSFRSSIKRIIMREGPTGICEYAFSGCENLTSVALTDTLKTIENGAFGGCNSLTKVTIPASVTYVGPGAFGSCDSLTEINVSAGNSNYCSQNGVLFNKKKTLLRQYPGGKIGTYQIPDSVTSIFDKAFCWCSGLTAVAIPGSVTEIDRNAFRGCSSLKSVTIPDSVTSIGGEAFSGCTSLTSVTIGNGVTSIGWSAFGGCNSLTSVTIGNGVTSIGSRTFYGCSSLKSVNIPDSVTSIGEYAFSDCSSLASLTIRNRHCAIEVLALNTYSTIYGYPDSTAKAYAEYLGYRFIALEDEEGTTLGKCGDNLYWSFEKSTGTIRITGAGAMDDFADEDGVWPDYSPWFWYGKQITGVYFYNGVTRIGSDAFRNCSGVTSVTIPASVTNIAEGAFRDCGSLKDVYYGADAAAWRKIKIEDDNDPLNCRMHYNSKIEDEPEPGKSDKPGKTGDSEKPGKTDKPAAKVNFVDVPKKAFYAGSVDWAVEKGVTNGLDQTHFGPDATCSRGQVVTFLWRAGGEKEPKRTDTGFADVDEKAFYAKAVAWAVEKKVTAGTSKNSFSPDAGCTRGQVVTFLWRAKGCPQPKIRINPFSDVSQSAYYYKAVLWAMENGITNGVSDTSFAPDATCTRGQIVTFLYRAVGGK